MLGEWNRPSKPARLATFAFLAQVRPQRRGNGYKRQEAAVRAWAKAHSVRIVRWFRESISGTTNPLDRPAFQDMLTALHSNGVKLVVWEKYDRVARDSMWIEWAMRANAQVVHIDPEGPQVCGVALEKPENIWDLPSPPEDWYDTAVNPEN